MRCPRTWHAPVTDEGRRFVAVMPQLSGQVRAGMGGAYAVDLTACLAVTDAAGIEREAALVFLRAFEGGLLRAMKLRSSDG